MTKSFLLDLQSLQLAYLSGEVKPEDVIAACLQRIEHDQNNVWIYRLSREKIEPYLNALRGKTPQDLPLYGVPFAIKDNIDLAHVPTTAACREFSYTPTQSAHAVQRLIDAGAIPMGKTNLDQFATGLNGTRSPYGVCHNAFNRDYISGGSSSGSAVAVALGHVSFSLGTDTAGSGRVPAAFNHLVGLKPTRGVISTRGVVPACRSLDCVSIFTQKSCDAYRLFRQLADTDREDAYSRKLQSAPRLIGSTFRFGVPLKAQREFFGNSEYANLFEHAITRLEQIGGTPVEMDFSPLFDAAKLLYDGPWLAERYVAIESIITEKPEALVAVTRDIIARGKQIYGVSAYQAFYRLAEYRRAAETLLSQVDVMMSPTAPSHYTIEAMLKDPIRLNTQLGYYTNFMNLLDLSAVAVPMEFADNGLPFGITIFADAFMDEPLLALSQRIQSVCIDGESTQSQSQTTLTEVIPLPTGWTTIAVCGAHMSGLPLNHQLTERGATLLQKTLTSKRYRLYALSGGPPFRPGLVRVTDGYSIELEVWAIPQTQLGSFVNLIPSPLGIGTIELFDGRRVQGFVCESYATETAQDISALGGWRKYLETK